MLDNAISVKLSHFDGPLGLLLHLIEKEEMSIKELDINAITKQYLGYLQKMSDLNFDDAGDFLLMAATLLHMKSNNCLEESPGQEDLKKLLGDDRPVITKAELIKRLEELKHFQEMGQVINNLPRLGETIFVRPKVNRKALSDSILSPVELDKLIESMLDFMMRERRKFKVVKRDRISIKEKLVSLKSKLRKGEQTRLQELLGQEDNIIDVVITFISVLELARLKKLDIYQNEDRGSVYINVLDDLDDLDVDTANGFDDENEDAEEAVELEATDVVSETDAVDEEPEGLNELEESEEEIKHDEQ